MVGEIGLGELADGESESGLFDLDSHTERKTRQRFLVGQLQLRSAAMVITEGDIEFLALGHYFDTPDRMAEEHVVPFDVMRKDLAGRGTFVQARPFVVQVPSLHVVDLEVEA